MQGKNNLCTRNGSKELRGAGREQNTGRKKKAFEEVSSWEEWEEGAELIMPRLHKAGWPSWEVSSGSVFHPVGARCSSSKEREVVTAESVSPLSGDSLALLRVAQAPPWGQQKGQQKERTVSFPALKGTALVRALLLPHKSSSHFGG